MKSTVSEFIDIEGRNKFAFVCKNASVCGKNDANTRY